MIRSVLVFALVAHASPALAASRGYSVTSFDRVVVEGPFDVSIVTGRAVSARAEGDMRAIDSVSLSITGRTLTIRRDRSAWGTYPGAAGGRVAIALSTAALTSASLLGDGDLAIDRMAGQSVTIGLTGNGSLTVGKVESDRASIGVSGAGSLTVAGKAALATVTVQGPAQIDARALAVTDLTANIAGSGNALFAAIRTARVTASGSGDVLVTGKPACTVKSSGSGDVRCGE